MRYFYFTYCTKKVMFNGITIKCENFPSKKDIEKKVNDLNAGEGDIIVTSMFEFQSKEDYNSFLNI